MIKIWTRFPCNLRVSQAIDLPPPLLRSNVCINYQVIGERDLRIGRLLSFICQCGGQDVETASFD